MIHETLINRNAQDVGEEGWDNRRGGMGSILTAL